MANKEESKTKCMTPRFRVSFPHVIHPQEADEGKKPRYGISMLFDEGTDLAPLKKIVHAAMVEKFGADKAKWPKGLNSPFRDQGEKEYEGYVAGNKFCNATSTQKPGLVDHNVDPIIDESEFYAGCYAQATVNAFYYGDKPEHKGNKGVAFGLNNVQKLADGEPLGGRVKPSDEFEPVAAEDADGEVFDDEGDDDDDIFN